MNCRVLIFGTTMLCLSRIPAQDAPDVVEVCENVATFSQANLNQIRSATGVYGLNTEGLFDVPGEELPVQSWNAEVDFTADFLKGRFFSDYLVVGQVDRRSLDGKQRDRISGSNSRDLAIITAEHFVWLEAFARPPVMELPPVDGLTEDGGRMAFRLQSTDSDQQSEFGRVFDPRKVWSDLPRLFGLYHTELSSSDSSDSSTLNVIAEIAGPPSEQLIRVIHTYPDQGLPAAEKSRNVFLIDPQTWHVIHWEYYSTGGALKKEYDWEYAPEDDGILFPKVFSQVVYKPSASTTQPWIKRLFTLRSVDLNKPLDETRFEISALGLQYGERLLDNIQGRMFVMDRAVLVPAEEFQIVSEKVYEREHRSLSPMWWGLGGVIAILVIATIARRKRGAV